MPTAATFSPQEGFSIEPLAEFYSQANRVLPRIEKIAVEKIPEPFKSLLVHRSDMTSTLEKFHGSQVHLRLLSRRQVGEFYFREVVLALDKTEKPVEFGAIKINLALFDAEARKLILGERFPLGHILRDCAIRYESRPNGFLKIESDDFMNRELKLPDSRWLYGRRNTLANLKGEALAEIVEILPP